MAEARAPEHLIDEKATPLDEPQIPQHLIDEGTAPLDRWDRRRLARVERSLERGLELQAWWRDESRKWAHEFDGDKLQRIMLRSAEENPDQRYQLLRRLPELERSEANYGFFDEASVDGRKRPIHGFALQTFFDEPKRHLVEEARDRGEVLESWRKGIREFALRYFIRLTSLHHIARYVDPDRRPQERWLRFLNWSPPTEEERGGFGMFQLYYKRRDTGRIGKFWPVDQDKIDLRRLYDDEVGAKKLDWIVVGVRMHDIHLRYPASPELLSLPFQETFYAVMSPDLIYDGEGEDEGVKGRYGFGFAFLEDPPEDRPNPWRMPQFGLQLNHFLVGEQGRTVGRVILVVDKQEQLLALNPLASTRWLADRASLGLFSPVLKSGLWLADRTMPGLFAPIFEQVRRAAGGLPVGRSFDPFSILVDVANSPYLPFVRRWAEKLSISKEEVLRSLQAELARNSLSTINGMRGVWRSVPSWTDEKSVPDSLRP